MRPLILVACLAPVAHLWRSINQRLQFVSCSPSTAFSLCAYGFVTASYRINILPFHETKDHNIVDMNSIKILSYMFKVPSILWQRL